MPIYLCLVLQEKSSSSFPRLEKLWGDSWSWSFAVAATTNLPETGDTLVFRRCRQYCPAAHSPSRDGGRGTGQPLADPHLFPRVWGKRAAVLLHSSVSSPGLEEEGAMGQCPLHFPRPGCGKFFPAIPYPLEWDEWSSQAECLYYSFPQKDFWEMSIARNFHCQKLTPVSLI